MRSYGLRKFYVSQMIKSKVDYNTREYLVGHKVSRGLDVNYDRTSEEDRLEEYAKAIDLLTIAPEYRLKKQIKELESVQAEELKQVKSQMEHLQSWMKGTFSRIVEYTESINPELSAQIGWTYEAMLEEEDKQ